MATTNSDVAHALNQTLSDLITLDLTIRQARRHLAGTPVHNLHLLLDGLITVARDAGNRIASRSIQLGHHYPNLWEETAARKKALRLIDVEPLRDQDAYRAFGQILDTINSRLTVNVRSSDCDLVTQALLIGLADQLDNVAWTIRARSAA